MLNNRFDFKKLEEEIVIAWDNNGLYCSLDDDSITEIEKTKAVFSMVLPPPNITGNLHVGHALCFAMQDILARRARAEGKRVVWKAGLDHAGIAGQLIMLKQIQDQYQIDSKTMTREELRILLFEHAAKWKTTLQQKIIQQMKCLGLSCDFNDMCFTMDEVRNAIINKIFVQLYNQKLIYKSKKMVNFDMGLSTAISDLEVINQKQQGIIYYIKYQICSSCIKDSDHGDDSDFGVTLDNEYITIATTRPETIFGDVAIAIHPEDERYRKYVGKYAIVPIIKRRIPIIVDSTIDMEKYTGAVKVTPAHDFFDYEIGVRYKLPFIVIMDTHGKLNENVPLDFHGFDRFVARQKIIAQLQQNECLLKQENIVHYVPYCDRTKSIVEPYLTEQWFMNIKAVVDQHPELMHELKFNDPQWRNMHDGWLRDVKDWCISRQTPWGPRIPIWYDVDGNVIAAENEEQAKKLAPNKANVLHQDPDVLDTWFSSSLWAFSAFGLPILQNYAKCFPTTTIVTGYDIIFFWIAKMAIMTKVILANKPFINVVVHGLIVDKQGKKMSKTVGNVIDPLITIQQVGSDALRLSLARQFNTSRTIKFGEESLEFGKKFITKLWNASNFIIICEREQQTREIKRNIVAENAFAEDNWSFFAIDWIKCEFNKFLDKTKDGFCNNRFDQLVQCANEFVWHKFCDWCLESVKYWKNYGCGLDELRGLPENRYANVIYETKILLYNILIVIHPIAPFITEAIAQKLQILPLGNLYAQLLPISYQYNISAAKLFENFIKIVTHIRILKNELMVDDVTVFVDFSFYEDMSMDIHMSFHSLLAKMCQCVVYKISEHGDFLSTEDKISNMASINCTIGEIIMVIYLSINDKRTVNTLINKMIAKYQKELTIFTQQLNNGDFLQYANEQTICDVQQQAKYIDIIIDIYSQLQNYCRNI